MTRVDLDFERVLLDGLGRILVSEKDEATATSVLSQVSRRLIEIPPIAFKHKVTTIMYRNVGLLAGKSDQQIAAVAQELASLLESDMAAAVAHRELLQREIAEITRVLGYSPIILKGFCNARYYPPSYTRWMRDIDLLCRDWDEALRILEKLLEMGYQYDEDESPWVKADTSRGRDLYGQIFLIRPEGKDFCRVDIHFGTYSIGYSGYLSLDLERASTGAEIGGVPIRVLKPEACIFIAQSHALSDGYVAVKDVNDFVAMATCGQDINWQEAGAVLRAHRLTAQASLLARHVLRLYSDPQATQAARSLLRECGSSRWSIWQTHNRSWSLRASVNAAFTYRWQRGRGDSVPKSAWRASQCYLFYIRRLQLCVRPRSRMEALFHLLMAKPDLSRWQLRPDACTLLIDAAVVQRLAAGHRESPRDKDREAVAVTGGIDVLARDKYQYVQVRDRLFVPTLDLIIPPAQAAAMPRS